MPPVQPGASAQRFARSEKLITMKVETHVALRHSLLLVMDANCKDIPQQFTQKGLARTDSCIAVGTLAFMDGATFVALTDESDIAAHDTSLRKIFSGNVKTPRKVLCVCGTEERLPILEIPVSGAITHVEVWTNHASEPSKVVIVDAGPRTRADSDPSFSRIRIVPDE